MIFSPLTGSKVSLQDPVYTCINECVLLHTGVRVVLFLLVSRGARVEIRQNPAPRIGVQQQVKTKPGLSQGDAVFLSAQGTSYPRPFPARRRYTARNIRTPIYVATAYS
jgi:hypothetical protein